MGVYDHLYVDKMEDLRIPAHILHLFEQLGYDKDKLYSSISQPIQVYFDGFFNNFKLDAAGNIWEETERDSHLFTKPAYLEDDSYNITLYDNGGDLDFTINSYAKITDGKIVGDINWYRCEIKKDGITYSWEIDDDLDAIEMDESIVNTLIDSSSSEGRMLLANSLTEPLRKRVGYTDIFCRALKVKKVQNGSY